MALTVPVLEIVEKSKNPLLGKHKSWRRILLKEIAEVLNGYAFKSANFSKEIGMPLIRIRDVGKDDTDTKYVGQYDDTYIVEHGDLLVGMDGDFNCARWRGSRGLLNQRVCKIILKSDSYASEFLDYVLPGYLKEINDLTSSVTVKHLSSTSIKEIPLPFPPLNEQKLIVAEIEKQFSRLDEAVAALKRIKANLKRYKASVLKAAVEGKLTEKWRKEHPDIEPASALLKRILFERRRKWEEAYPKKKYKEPAGPEIEGLPPIPDTWTWATLPQLGELNRGKSKHRPRNDAKLYDGPYPFIQTGDVRHAMGVINEYSRTYSEEGLKQSRLWPKGTLCITIAANIADTAILGFDACFPDSVVGFIADTDFTEVRFVEYFLRTAKENLERFASATAQKNINIAILSSVAVPLPPYEEQKQLIWEIEQRLSVADRVEIEVDANMKRAERLHQALLKKAFCGKLVPQDPNDDPVDHFLPDLKTCLNRRKVSA